MYERYERPIEIGTVRQIRRQIKALEQQRNAVAYAVRKGLDLKLTAFRQMENDYKVALFSRLTEKASQLFQRQNFYAAESCYRELLELNCSLRVREYLLDQLAKCCSRQYRKFDEMRYLKRSRKSAYQLAEAQMILGEYADAEAAFLWVLPSPAGEFDLKRTYNYIAKCSAELGEFDRARRARRQAMRIVE